VTGTRVKAHENRASLSYQDGFYEAAMLRAGVIGFVAIKRHIHKYLQKLLNVVGREKG
jgi:hypothetical protein